MCFGQIKPTGFTREVANLINPLGKRYNPKLLVVNDTLFVCSSTGVYQKDMLRNSSWELYAFEGAPVIEFVRNGNKLLANAMSAANGRDSLLLFSRDNGKSFEDYTSSSFWEYGQNHLFRIAQNPQNLNSILTLTTCSGLNGSGDFGKNWQNLHPYSLGIHVAYASFHPLDTTAIYYSGENDIFSGRIFKSLDNGNTWAEYEVPGGDNCVHQIDFHPSDPNILIFGGEGKLGKSIDKGETWKVVDIADVEMYFYKVLFDRNHPDTLYASGFHGHYRDYQDTVFVFRSTDMGETWNLAYKEYLGANGGGVIDMVKYKDKLIFYTNKLGVLELDVKTTPVLISNRNIATKRYLTIYPNPVRNTLHFKSDVIIRSVDIINSTGGTVRQVTFYGNEKSVDVSNLSTGIYFATFYADQHRITEKVFIE